MIQPGYHLWTLRHVVAPLSKYPQKRAGGLYPQFPPFGLMFFEVASLGVDWNPPVPGGHPESGSPPRRHMLPATSSLQIWQTKTNNYFKKLLQDTPKKKHTPPPQPTNNNHNQQNKLAASCRQFIQFFWFSAPPGVSAKVLRLWASEPRQQAILLVTFCWWPPTFWDTQVTNWMTWWRFLVVVGLDEDYNSLKCQNCTVVLFWRAWIQSCTSTLGVCMHFPPRNCNQEV